jgi:hypothetical protein
MHKSIPDQSTFHQPAMTAAARSRSKLLFYILVGVLFLVLAVSSIQPLATLQLGDFTVTFYRAGLYLLRGENVYTQPYPHPTLDRQFPPFNPIWILYFTVPLSVFPLEIAQGIRFAMEFIGIGLCTYLSMRWARIRRAGLVVLLAAAPWNMFELITGQWSAFALLGTLLCYLGTQQASAWTVAVGLWLVLVKPNITSLIVFATLAFAQRRGILLPVLGRLMLLIAITSIAQPTWIADLLELYLDRLVHPRPVDSLLLLPGWPWSQLLLLAGTGLILLVYVWKVRDAQPTPWLWSVLTCVSLVGAIHTFTYDWLMLMLPIAWLLRDWRGTWFTLFIYAYPLLWDLLAPTVSIWLVSPSLIPLSVLVALLLGRKANGRATSSVVAGQRI